MALKSVGDPDNVETSSARTPMMTGVEKPSGDPGVRAPFKGEWVDRSAQARDFATLNPPLEEETLAQAPAQRFLEGMSQTVHTTLVYTGEVPSRLNVALHELRMALCDTRMTEHERAYVNKALAFLDTLVNL